MIYLIALFVFFVVFLVLGIKKNKLFLLGSLIILFFGIFNPYVSGLVRNYYDWYVLDRGYPPEGYCDPGPCVKEKNNIQAKDDLKTLKNLTDWKIQSATEWSTNNLDKRYLAPYPVTSTTRLYKVFNEDGEPDYTGRNALEAKVKKVLVDEGWVLSGGPMEGGHYNQYLYVKNGVPLIFDVGTRDAVSGGMYVAIQFKN